VEALRQERSEVEEQQKELIRQREAQLEAEKEQREALAQQLEDTKVGRPFAAALSCLLTTLVVLLPGLRGVLHRACITMITTVKVMIVTKARNKKSQQN